MLEPEPVKPSFIDSALSVVSPERGLRRLAAKQRLNEFHYIAAKPSPSRKLATPAQHQNPNNYSNNQDRLNLMYQARDMEENSPIVSGILDKLCLYTTAKLAFQSRCGDPEVEAEHESYFHEWARNNADATGRYTLRKLVELALRGFLRDGDHGLAITESETGVVQLYSVEADRIGNPSGPQMTNRQDYIAGVLIDELTGIPKGYEVYRRTTLNQYSLDVTYEPSNFIHLFDPTRTDAHRGISYFHSVLNHVKDLQDLLSYEKQAAKFAASYAGFITSSNPYLNQGAGAFKTKATADQPGEMASQSGKIVRLSESESISFAPGPDRPSGAFLNLVETLEAQIAAGLGLPIGFIKDFSRFGGVTARLESQLVMRSIQRWQDLLVDKVLDRVKNLVLAKGISNGHISNHKNWKAGNWQFAAHLTADIGHEVTADLSLHQAGGKTLRSIVEAQGNDFRDTMEQLADEILIMQDVAGRKGIPIELFVQGKQDATNMLAGMNTPTSDPTLAEAVGDKGVSNLIEILEKVGEGILPPENAVQIMIHTYGLDPVKARNIVPKKAASIDVTNKGSNGKQDSTKEKAKS